MMMIMPLFLLVVVVVIMMMIMLILKGAGMSASDRAPQLTALASPKCSEPYE